MKIIVLHGDDTNKSYQRLGKFVEIAKSRGWEIIYDELNPTASLFGKERLIVLKDYKLYSPKSRFSGTLVIYHSGNIPSSFLKKLPDAKIERFDLPKILWKFLDRPSVRLLHEVVKKEPIELVFHLFAKRLRKTKYVGKLAQMDYEAKTGRVDLTLSLDLFIAKHLE